jgi:hypothetical protein
VKRLSAFSRMWQEAVFSKPAPCTIVWTLRKKTCNTNTTTEFRCVFFVKPTHLHHDLLSSSVPMIFLSILQTAYQSFEKAGTPSPAKVAITSNLLAQVPSI